MKLFDTSLILSVSLTALYIALPFSVAIQNIASGLLLIFGINCALKMRLTSIQIINPGHFAAKLGWVALAIWLSSRLLIGAYYGNIGPEKLISSTLGYLAVIIFPIVIPKLSKVVLHDDLLLRQLTSFAAVLCFFWFVIALTQRVWGWAFFDSSFHFGIFRAQALYSHPLTFAYILALLLPITLRAALAAPHSVRCWAVFGMTAATVILNESRTVQVTSLVVCTVMAFMRGPKRLAVIVISAMLLTVIAIMSFPNSIENKFRGTWEQAIDRTDNVPDDRVVFWQAHWELIIQRPVLGWGAEIPKSVMLDAYKAIGREAFEKKYNAHNLYIQTLAESGLVGLLALLIWIASLLVLCREFTHTAEGQPQNLGYFPDGLMFGFINFFFASATQNSLYDAEVRYAVMLSLVTLFSISQPKAERIAVDQGNLQR
jgi:O-antigen ligase